MTARRQASTTSLSKYARATSPGLQNRSLDFCNAFWGIADGGVDVLFARMRGAARTMEELRNFWKERAAIEDDYAKRLGKLAKGMLGRDEIGDLRGALDTIRTETEKQATFHATLAGQVRTELESTAATFHVRQMHHKKTVQAGIEKEFKNKQAQEGHVNKAREKYEQDCVRINSFTAQASLVQGKDLEKINLKLERAQQTVHVNERDFANFAKALQDTVQRWEMDWKAFCDSCQDMEEQRMEFMKDNMWAFANAVSTVCVSDDESCEKIRVSLEQMEAEKEMENFVRDYGTGNQMPDPPTFVNYSTPDAIPSSSSQPTFRPAQFSRNSHRDASRQSWIPSPVEPETPQTNIAGRGAGGPKRESQYDATASWQGEQPKRASTMPAYQAPQSNGNASPSSNMKPGTSPSPSGQPPSRQSISFSHHASYRVPPQDPLAEPIDPMAETYIKIGNDVYKADPNKDPQAQNRMSIRGNNSPSPKVTGNGAIDPLAKQMETLRNAVSSSGSVRRKSIRHQSAPSDPRSMQHRNNDSIGGSSLSPPSSTPNLIGSSPTSQTGPQLRDYRNSAELVVGVYPSASPSSRPSSPNPPTAAFMVKPSVSPSGSEVIQDVLTDYQQSLPGERKSISRSNSIAGRRVSTSTSQSMGSGHVHSSSQGQNLARPSSTMGHPGIGAHGGSRSNSPQPPSRGPSPAPGSFQDTRNRNSSTSYISPPSATGPSVARSASPNTVGIALDPNGRVMHDDMAYRYQQQQQQQQQQQYQRQAPIQQQMPQQQRPPPPHQPPPTPQSHQPPLSLMPQQQPQQPQQQQQQGYSVSPTQRRTSSYMGPPVSTTPIQPYGVAPPQTPMYQAPVSAPNPGRSVVVNHMQQQTAPPPPAVVQAAPPPPPQQYNTFQPPPPPPIQAVVYQPQPQAVYHTQQQQQPAPPPQQQQQSQYYGAPPPQQPPPQLPTQHQHQQHQQHQQQPQQQQHQQQHQQSHQLQRAPTYQQHQYGTYRGPSPVMQRTPSPQPPTQQQQQPLGGQMVAPPTGQTTEEGHGILFYVKALYDYSATIEEEFDFQAGDIIAVTATPEDGWWSGELLDEDRRQKGRHVFPSNFVCLF